MSIQADLLSSNLIGNVGFVETVSEVKESSRDNVLSDLLADLTSIIENDSLSNFEIQQSIIQSLSAIPYTYYFKVLTQLSEWIDVQELELSLNESDARVLARSELIQNLKQIITLALVSQAKDMQLKDLFIAYNALNVMQNTPSLNPKVKEFMIMLSIAILVLLGIVGYAGYRSEQERLEEERERVMGQSVEDFRDESDIFATIEL